MENSLRRFSSNTESRRLLRDDEDEEEYESKEGIRQLGRFEFSKVSCFSGPSDFETTTVLIDKTINFLKKESEDFDHKEYINRVAEAIIKNVDDESYCPEVKRVFETQGAAIDDYCKKARNEIPEERPTDKYEKLFKFPVLTLNKNVVKSNEMRTQVRRSQNLKIGAIRQHTTTHT